MNAFRVNSAVAAAVLFSATGVAARPGDEQGIWKSFVPKGATGEFAGKDPMGLIAGKQIQADCSLNWRDQHGKLYCFSSGTSLVYFLQMPNTNAAKARAKWDERKTEPAPADFTQ